jgi:type II secretory pathway predicted ATPase ExeA
LASTAANADAASVNPKETQTRVGVFGTKGQDELLRRPDGGQPQSNAHEQAVAALEAAFREIADPASYVARDATEWVLRELESALADARRPAALVASPGMGKTILLHVLAERLSTKLRVVFLPYGSLSIVDLCAWALGRIGEPWEGDPVRHLLEFALQLAESGRGLLLQVDDADGLGVATARELMGLQADSGGALRLVLASPDDARSAGVLAALGPDLKTVRFSQTMTFEETADFVRQRIEQANVPRVTQNRFDHECVEWIFSQSGGVPRLAQRLGQSILVERPADVAPSWRHNSDWPGAPLDER